MKKNARIPFWLQIVLILLTGVLASVGILAARSGSEPDLPRYTVTFAYSDGTVIEAKEVSEGKGVYPPEYIGEGVFRGWSGRFNQVTSDVEVHPVIHSIGEDNLFYFHSVYVEEGKSFALDVQLGGRVSVSSGELTILYDPAVLEYRGADSEAFCSVTEGAEGELTLTFEAEEPIRKETLLAKLNFCALEKDAYATEVQLQAKNVKIVSDGEELPADCATINNKVFFLQEVEP